MSGAQPLLPPLMNAGRQSPKNEHVEKVSAIWAHRPALAPLLHRPNPRSAGRPEVGSLAGWILSPVLYLHLEPKVLPARAELVPRCPKPVLLQLPTLRDAMDPALARPPLLEGQWAPAPHTFGPRAALRPCVLLQNRQTPSPTPPRLFVLTVWTAAPR